MHEIAFSKCGTVLSTLYWTHVDFKNTLKNAWRNFLLIFFKAKYGTITINLTVDSKKMGWKKTLHC